MLAVFAAAALLYLPSISFDFTFDDRVIVETNPVVQDPAQWTRIFWSDYWPGTRSALYRPVTMLSFVLDRGLHGGDPAGYHAANVVLHSLSALLLFLLVSEMGGAGWTALAAALLFAVHPIHTEAVCGVVGRAELLSTFLALSTLCIWVKRIRTPSGSPGHYWAGLLLFAGALGSKENVIVLPALLVLLELTGTARKHRFRRLVEVLQDRRIWGFAAVAAAFFIARAQVLGGFAASLAPDPPFVENPLVRLPAGVRLLNALAIQWKAAVLHVIPRPLIADYSYETIPLRTSGFNGASLAFLILCTAGLLLWLARTQSGSRCAFSLSFYLLALLPAGNIVFLAGTLFAERLLFFPSIGFCLLVAFLAAPLLPGGGFSFSRPKLGRHWSAFGFLLVLLAALTLATWNRIPVWRTDLTLFDAAVRDAPRNVKARLWFGDALVRGGEPARAVEQYREALEILPDYGAASANLAAALLQLGRIREAIDQGERALELFPEGNAALLYNLAVACHDAGDPVRFLDYIQRCLQLDPRHARAHMRLGLYLLREAGDRKSARSHLQTALQLDPEMQDAAQVRAWLSRIDSER